MTRATTEKRCIHNIYTYLVIGRHRIAIITYRDNPHLAPPLRRDPVRSSNIIVITITIVTRP